MSDKPETYNGFIAPPVDNSFWEAATNKAAKAETPKVEGHPYDQSSPAKMPPLPQEKPACPPAFPFIPR